MRPAAHIKMIMNFKLITLGFAWLIPAMMISSGLQAQESQHSVTIGFDPLVIGVLNGVEVEAGYNRGKNRVAVEFLSAELPSVWNSQIDDFEKVSSDIFEIGYSRFLKDGQRGFHYGLAYSLFSNFTVEDANGLELSKDLSKIGVRLGYMWFPIKNTNFFIEPLFNFGIYLNDEDLNFGGDTEFESSSFAGSGPVIHLGWKFDL